MNGRLGCRQVQGALQAFLDGEVEPQRAEFVAAHLGRCSRCHVEAHVLTRVIATIRRVRPDLDQNTYTRLVAAVAGLTDRRAP